MTSNLRFCLRPQETWGTSSRMIDNCLTSFDDLWRVSRFLFDGLYRCGPNLLLCSYNNSWALTLIFITSDLIQRNTGREKRER